MRIPVTFAAAALCLAVSPAPLVAAQHDAKETEKEKPPLAAKSKPPTVTLLEPGEEPRSPIRYRVEKGSREELVMTMRMAMAMEANGFAIPEQRLPGQQMTMDLSVTDVAANGDITYAFTMGKVEMVETDGVLPQVVESVKSALEGFEGTRGRVVVTDRGIVKEAKLELGEKLQPMLRQMLQGFSQSLESMSNPVPEEAVGKGARWRVVNDMEVSGIRMRQTAICRLAMITESLRRVELELEQKGEAQDVAPPGLLPGAKVRLKSLAGKGSGEVLFDQTRVFPRQSSVEVVSESEMSIDVGVGAGTQAMRQRMTMKVAVSGRKVGA
jgi:hypothetical protein